MQIHMLKCKLHRASVTGCELDYEGSLTLDPDLMEAAGLLANEMVQVLNITNGNRFETYVIKGTRGEREVVLNGAAARLCERGDRVIVVAQVTLTPEEAASHVPTVVLLDEHNKIKDVTGPGVYPGG